MKRKSRFIGDSILVNRFNIRHRRDRNGIEIADKRSAGRIER